MPLRVGGFTRLGRLYVGAVVGRGGGGGGGLLVTLLRLAVFVVVILPLLMTAVLAYLSWQAGRLGWRWWSARRDRARVQPVEVYTLTRHP